MMIASPASVKPREETGGTQLPRERFLAPTVFITGASVLTLEILGTRLLSPHFGSNLYVWAALISVTLIALALGYWVGGKLADSKGAPALLDQVIAAAAVWVAIIPDLVAVFAGLTQGLEYRAGILSTALISFGPALCILGLIAPLAVKLAVRDLEHVGRSSGAIYAWSTAGGIAGALGAGFLLFPVVSIVSACHITSLVLVVLAAGRYIARKKSLWMSCLPGAFLLLAGIALPSAFLPAPTWEEDGFHVVANYPSYYGSVRVVDYRGARMLMIDGTCHNAINLKTGEALMPHVALFEMLPYMRPDASTALLIGLGGGDMLKSFERFGIRTTGVEIDPVVVRAAKQHFDLRTAGHNVVIGDGRVYLRSAEEQFDLITFDAFMGGAIPAHLYSQNAFRAARRRLKPGGVLALNVVTLPGDHMVDDFVVTLEQLFRHVSVFAVRAQDGSVENVAFFASDQPLPMPSEWNPEPSALLKDLLEDPAELVLEADRARGTIITDQNNFLEAKAAEVDIALRLGSRRLLPPSLLIP